MQQTEVIYNHSTHDGKVKVTVNCMNEFEYNISVENRKWLYPKLENILFATECMIRADPSMAHQINKVIDKTVNDLMKLVEISQER